jgi:hypothetical protein
MLQLNNNLCNKILTSKISDFDINIYRLFNDDLRELTDEELNNHYNYYGKFENRISSKIDFCNKYPEFNLDKLNNNEIMYKYTKYSNKSEKIYYENMNIDYVVDYLEKNNIKILITVGDYDESSGGITIFHYFCHLINYVSKTNIAYLVNIKDKPINYYEENDFYLKTNKDYITPLATKKILCKRNNIVIYGDDMIGNPLEQKYVVRWMTYFELGSRMKSWNNNDLIIWFCDLYRKYNDIVQKFNNNTLNKTINNNHVIISILSNIEKLFNYANNNNLNKKDECCFTLRKIRRSQHNRGRSIYQHEHINFFECENCQKREWPSECNCENSLDGVELKHNKKYNKVYRFEYPIKISDEIELFKNTGTFYCYDPFSFSSVIAVLHNCLTVTPKLEIFGDNNIYENAPWAQYGISYGEDDESINNALRTLPFSKILLSNLFFNINYDNMKIFFESIYSHFFTKKFVTNISGSIKANKPKILIYMNSNGNEIKSLLETNIVFRNNFEIIVINNNLEIELKDTYILIYEYQNNIKDIPDYVKKISLPNINFNELLNIDVDSLINNEKYTDIKVADYILKNYKNNDIELFMIYVVNEIIRLLNINIELG